MGFNYKYVFPKNRKSKPDFSRSEAIERAATALGKVVGSDPALGGTKIEWYDDPENPQLQIGVVPTCWGFGCPQCEEIITDGLGRLLNKYYESNGAQDDLCHCPSCGQDAPFSKILWHGLAASYVLITFPGVGFLEGPNNIFIAYSAQKDAIYALPEWKALQEAFDEEIDFLEGKF